MVAVWRDTVDPTYQSPYSSRRILNGNYTRELQASAKLMESSIVCITVNDAVSFEVSPENFPVYVKDSIYNTDPNYDNGLFTKLKNKLLLAELDLDTFMVTFNYVGVFVFGDYQSPTTAQTIVKVAELPSECQG